MDNIDKGGIELRACNSQPSEPFIYWGLKSYRSTFNDISAFKSTVVLFVLFFCGLLFFLMDWSAFCAFFPG